MIGYNTRLTPELQEIAESLADKAREAGLDFFDTIFEVVDYKQLNEIAAYGGFPTRYPHWRWGMDYERLSKSYTYGLSIIYEMVINNDPCYAYLLRANDLVYQKTVIAHVYGHCDFFKNNYWFSKTDRKMLNQMANHAALVRHLINDIGHDEVENFIDTCLSIENLIDIHLPHKEQEQRRSSNTEDSYRDGPIAKLSAKKYMDSYINPEEFVEQQRQKQRHEAARQKSFPEQPQKDVLRFLIQHAPMPSWEKRVLEMIRDEAYYFAPQAQTKILNEGWATYWHSKMMTQLAPLRESEIIDYCDHYAGVVASQPGNLNPYKLGVELLRHVESRWDKGQFGIEYTRLDDPKDRAAWNKDANLGRTKIFEIRRHHNDITFLDEYLDEDFCHQTKMFLYDYDTRNNRYVISSRDFRPIKQQLLKQLTNFGQPIIEVVDGNFKNRGELLLKHRHDGTDLKNETASETLRNLQRIWRRPVHLETVVENTTRRFTFDGTKHQIEKV